MSPAPVPTSLDLSIEGMTFEGFDQGFADRAAQAFETGLRDGLAHPDLAARLADLHSRALGAVVLDLPHAATPEDFGAALAQVILDEVSR